MKKKIKPPVKLLKYLYHVEGWSLREIGNLFGISYEAVRKRMEKKKNK